MIHSCPAAFWRKRVTVHHAGTKLSFNLQSQNRREPTLFVLRLRESRFRRGKQRSHREKTVNRQKAIFLGKMKISCVAIARTGGRSRQIPPIIYSVIR
jgi:hypothetical protein